MSAVTPKTNMPYPLHSNSILENLIENENVEGTLLTLQRWAEKLEAEATTEQLEILKKGLPKDFSIDEKFKIVKNPIRLSTGGGGEAMAPRFLDRNVDLYLVRAQKLVEGKYSYKQIKRAQLSQLYFTLQSLFLVEYMRNEERIPVGFNWESKDVLFHEDLKAFITRKEENDSPFPKIKSDKGELAINRNNIKDILVELEEMGGTVQRLTPILMRHEHAWKKMMSTGCTGCGKRIGEACPNDKLAKLIDTDAKHFSSLGAQISRLNLGKPENEAEYNKMMNRVLLKYYTKAGITGELLGGVKELFAGENELKVPFACKERYGMQTSSWNDAIVGSFFPLSRRKEEPKTTGARLYFGSTAPPSLLVQNLMADAIKRILARKLVEGGKRMGIDVKSKLEYHPRKDRLLWEYIASCKNGTVQTKLIDGEYESGSEFHSLSILEFGKGVIHQPAAEGFRGEMTHCLQLGREKWEWNVSSKGKLPIVSPNVTLAEINSIFTLNEKVKGVVICIDHWGIDGDDEEWDYSEEGDKYWGVGPNLFHNDEPKKGARTFVTFLKRIIDKSKYGIKREDVVHTRRAYGVLLKEDLNNFLKSE